jgi:biotin operon repressor
MAVLRQYKGAANGVTCARLATLLGLHERQVRKLVSAARFDGEPVVGTPQTGYYLAESPAEVEQFANFFWHRARHSLAIVSRVKGMALPELLGQMQLEPEAL